MSQQRSLQKVLSIQFMVAAVIPVVLLGMLMYAYLAPLAEEEIAATNQRLVDALRAESELFLGIPEAQLKNLRSVLNVDGLEPIHSHGNLLDASVSATNLFEAIYLVDDQGQVVDVGLPSSQRPLRNNYLGLDVSGRRFIANAQHSQQLTWSDTFLSVVSGKISLGLAVPFGRWVLVGDFSIERLSDFVNRLDADSSTLAIILDRKGHVIAHPSGELTGQQLNISTVPLVETALKEGAVTGLFVFDDKRYIASTARIPGPGWTALAGEFEQNVYRERNLALTAASLAIAGAALLAILIALHRARSLAEPIRVFTEQAERLAESNVDVHVPSSRIRELATMGTMFTFMANAIREREKRIADSQQEYRHVVESTDNVITRVDGEGKLLFVNSAACKVFGLSSQELLGRSAFEFVHPDDREATLRAFNGWMHDAHANITFENRQCAQNGQIHHMLWTISISRDATGAVMSFDSIGRDITERKHAEDELRDHQQAIEYAAEQEQVLVAISRLSLETHSMETFLESALELICQARPWLNVEARGAVLLPTIGDGGRRIAAAKGVDRQLLARLNILSADPEQAQPPSQSGDEQNIPQLVAITGDGNEIGHLVLFKRPHKVESDENQTFINRVADILSLGVLRRLAETEIEYLAYHDALTGLANRRLLLDRLDMDLLAARRRGYFSALLFLDLDHFKTINDALGHTVGDMLLCQVAERLRERTRGDDTVVRLGGDEFVLLLTQISTSAETARFQTQTLAEELCTLLAQPYTLDGNEQHLSASIGIVIYPSDEESAGDILRRADEAMYSAKDEGRNTAQFYQHSMQVAADARFRLSKELRHAVDDKQFVLHYHAQVNGAGKVIGAEALIRWQHPEIGVIAPDDFIPIAEESGMIAAIGEWVLRQACTQLRLWLDNGMGSSLHSLAINVSPWQFRQRDFVASTKAIIAETGAPPARLMLEITEGLLVENVDDARQKIIALKKLGIGFSIDDFGTGYSSLAYLRSLPLDELKVDRSFIRDLLDDANDAAIVDTILAMASRLSLHVTAEGVETTEQLHFLRARGCQGFQGYLFARPLPALQFEEFCRDNKRTRQQVGPV